MTNKFPRATPLPGGNAFDDLRVDIQQSHLSFRRLKSPRRKTISFALINRFRFYLDALLMKLGFYETLAINGIYNKWFHRFTHYWSHVLGGRPLWNKLDFFFLLHDYRKSIQSSKVFNWDTPSHHLKNWQAPSNLYHTLHYVRKLATRPIINPTFWKHLRRRARVLEYGCSLAPYYSCYSNYFSHLNCSWTLADIPNFPFHYCKFANHDSSDVEFLTIYESLFNAPLADCEPFDAIILTEVFEHLDNPLPFVRHMFSKLNSGGIFIFDFILSDGTELDHPVALAQRMETLKFISDNFIIVNGDLSSLQNDVSMTIVQKP